jgi:2-hydroxychromene-2-carboxylate isomerase
MDEQTIGTLVNIMDRPKAWDDIHKPLTDNVNEQNPLNVYLQTSFRSGYCYIGMERYAALQREYNVNFNVRFVRPILMRDPSFFLKASDYRYRYDPVDMGRQAQFLGIPWRKDGLMVPDICGTAGNIVTPAPDEEQGIFFRVYSISALIQTEHPDKAMGWAQRMFRIMYGGVDNWQNLIPAVLADLGIEVDATEKKAKKDQDKYMKIIEKNEELGHASGHGGVPNAIFRGEPFWGQDRVDVLLWRLKQNGLTKRWPKAFD